MTILSACVRNACAKRKVRTKSAVSLGDASAYASVTTEVCAMHEAAGVDVTFAGEVGRANAFGGGSAH